MKKVTPQFELDKRSLGKKDQKYAVKLAVYFDKNRKAYKTDFRFNEEE